MRAALFGICLSCLVELVVVEPSWSQTPSSYIRSSRDEARIEVFGADRASFTIPRTVYGTFLEDIGHSVFGGVSAELLDNPSFESYDASLATLKERFSSPPFEQSTKMGLPLPWLPLRESQGWRYEPRWGHAANSNRYLYVMGLPDQEVGIRQEIYLPIERERNYEGLLFASSAEGRVILRASLRRHDYPDAVLASTDIEVPGSSEASTAGSDNGWQKLNFRLTLPEGALAPLEPVDFAVSVQGQHRVSLDETLLYPSDAINGFDPDVVKFAKALHSPLLRFGGNFTSGYHWRDGVGPLEQRLSMLNQSWGFPEYNLFGIDELMKFCDVIGARPQLCLNLGSGTLQEARQLVEYCQGAASTPGGALRAANGHAEPYPVAAWELGNELWGQFQIGWETPLIYPGRYRAFYAAIRDAVPGGTMIFANGQDVDAFRDWNGALLEKDADILSYLTTHFVVGMESMDNKLAGRDAAWAADFALPQGVARGLENVKAQIDANAAARDRVKIAFTEWLFWAPEGSDYPRWDNLGGAILCASWMNMLLNHADFVPVSDMTGLLEFGGIQKNRGRVFVTPQYWAFSLYSNYAGDSPLRTRTDVEEYDVHGGEHRVPDIANVPYLDVLATTDSVRHDLVIFVVNRHWRKAIPATVQLRQFVPAPEALVRTLNAGSILARNNEEQPDAVGPATTRLHVAGTNIRYEFPAHSLTVISLNHQ